MKTDTHTNLRRRRKKHTFGKIMAIIQMILSAVFLGVLFIINILPMQYMIILFGILLFLCVFAFFSQMTRSAHVIGKIDCVIMCVLLILGNVYLIRANMTLFAITSNNYTIDRIAVAVLADDPAQTLQDAAGYEFGAQQVGGSDRMDQAISQIVEQVGQDISYYNYDDVFQLTQDLYNGNVEAIIYNTAYNASLEEQFEGFSQNVRELESVEIRTEVLVVAGDNKDVTKNAFTVFISGIDTEGSIATVSRSDVNMLVTVNPKTKQILMTSIPRDYFVELPGVSEGQRDKLTHAGMYGVDCSMNTLESLFGVEINYYARVNFTTLRDIVNALGGVDLDSRYEFTTISGEYFTQGMNYDVDGSSALAFARERKNLPGGDNDRVLNQQTVLKAILNKCMSPAILTGYMGIMESLSNSFETNLSQSQISSLVRMQLSDGAAWNIVSSAVVGTDSKDYCYSSGDEILYVMEPDYGSVETAAGFMDRVLNGEMITQEEVSAAEGL